jgi:tetratricopeptide (TPR) repeat protein
MLCPKCKAEYKGAVARCAHCGADLLPKKNLIGRVIPFVIALICLVIPFLWPRVPGFLRAAFGPTMTSDRYWFRAVNVAETDPEQAIADLTEYLEIAPEFLSRRLDALYLRAEAYSRLGRTQDAIGDLEEMIGSWSGTGFYNPHLQSNVERMLDDLRAIEVDPATVESGDERIELYARRAVARAKRQRRYVEAADEAGKAIELDPTFSDAYRIRGYAYYRAGQPDAAVEDLETALALLSENPEGSEQTAVTRIRMDIGEMKAGKSPLWCPWD